MIFFIVERDISKRGAKSSRLLFELIKSFAQEFLTPLFKFTSAKGFRACVKF